MATEDVQDQRLGLLGAARVVVALYEDAEEVLLVVLGQLQTAAPPSLPSSKASKAFPSPAKAALVLQGSDVVLDALLPIPVVELVLELQRILLRFRGLAAPLHLLRVEGLASALVQRVSDVVLDIVRRRTWLRRRTHPSDVTQSQTSRAQR